ncbi:hypothetical protein ONZ45_g7608 [Pleurotus djamor]|nr:hypothetical protein ONZ45_g7608 [Pleurotus djamor]
MSNSTTFDVPNPLTPLAYLPRDLANQFEVSRYLYAITLGAYMWDCAVNLGNDYKLLVQNKVRFPTIIYYLSRICTMAYIITSFVFQVGQVADCQALQLGLGICNVLSQAFTSMLFYLRAQAVWHYNPIARGVYLLLWLGVVGCSLTVPIGIRGAHIGPTMACINTVVPEYAEATLIMALINDSAVFFGITYRILAYSVIEDSFTARAKHFFGKGKMSSLPRSLLQGGQHYYLIAVLGNVVALTLLKLSYVPPVYHGMMTIPVLAIVNAMACIVFRKIKFGLISHDGTDRPVVTDGAASVLPAHYYRRRPTQSDGTTTFIDGGSVTDGIKILKDTQVVTDCDICLPLQTRPPPLSRQT